ncbi:MAG TPA: zinc-ribbon domain-containing protein [Myxococcota bacterium]|jgi:predicted Zn finger-like uncharacterized protein|nr:zinc-ribbon domain-containing protein [Myxococcota bacterium]
MIAVCPKCSARYRVDTDKLGDGEAKLRCSRCQAVFRVRAPAAAPAEPAEPQVARAAAAPPPAAPAAAAPLDRARTVLVAHPDVETAKAWAGLLAGLGLQPLLAHDGVEALLGLQRNLPRAAVLQGALPRMNAAELCEIAKRNAELREIALVVVDATPPRSAGAPFGPDERVDGVRLETALPDALRRLGLPVAARPSAPAPPVAPTPAPVRPTPPVAAPPPPPAPVDDGLGAERGKAERLARIIVSDVVLYNEQKFMKAVVAGNVRDALDADLEEGRTLFRQRIDARVRDERDYIGEELVRVARSRGMQG